MLAGRYELDQEIGRGAMGVVWRGRDTLLDRVVAIKQLGVTGGDAPDLERALREAHLAASVAHHNVVSVFDLAEEDGRQWLVMELVDGPTLRDRIAAAGTLGPAELRPVLRQVAGALAAAHEHGIVHRDVKPSNILLTRGGTAKLSDFGIARGQADHPLTQTGLVTGSPAYLSPEVASGRSATPASDVWSLGATAFHALEGRQPYETGDNVLGAMYRIVHDDPPRPTSDSGLARVVASMMQHDPDARPTMSEIEQLLADDDLAHDDLAHAYPADDDPGTATMPAPVVQRDATPSSRRWLPVGIAAVAALIVAGVAVAALSGRDDEPAPQAAPTATQTASPTPSASATSPDAATTAGAIEGFVADYLTTAGNDPRAAYELLTADFQRESGGYRGYEGFWGEVEGLDVRDIQADPANLTVSYTYSYDRNGDRRTDDVVLQLEQTADGFLIAGEA